ncbi:uncharacterized protein LOC130642001 [Hydractinia symbiolongicarpus]|uniref:uncharacterized protein LOC130642001 n=1 Tax=Hydractinia symbiolongicarpus TaxID=13093 RepID=UPI002551AA58|nr:uncharacterized protein LOC130642001 [Hydractinia symbiolongicarpus]
MKEANLLAPVLTIFIIAGILLYLVHREWNCCHKRPAKDNVVRDDTDISSVEIDVETENNVDDYSSKKVGFTNASYVTSDMDTGLRESFISVVVEDMGHYMLCESDDIVGNNAT